MAAYKKERIFRIELISKSSSDKESLYLEDVHTILEGLNLGPEFLDGLQPRGGGHPTSYNVRVKDLDIWQSKNLDRYFGQEYTLHENGKKFIMSKAYEDVTTVIVKNVPMYWEQERLWKIFAFYGEVKKSR